jgi:hypothetical protein
MNTLSQLFIILLKGEGEEGGGLGFMGSFIPNNSQQNTKDLWVLLSKNFLRRGKNGTQQLTLVRGSGALQLTKKT